MIFIILFFAPDILHKQATNFFLSQPKPVVKKLISFQDTIMREIVDKHFADNWVPCAL
jgi:hypothetical protein